MLAGDIDNGSDGTITLESTKVPNAQFVRLTGLSHAAMRYHPTVIDRISAVLAGRKPGRFSVSFHPIIEKIRAVPGMTDAHQRGFDKAATLLTLEDGISIRVWRSPLGVDQCVCSVSPRQISLRWLCGVDTQCRAVGDATGTQGRRNNADLDQPFEPLESGQTHGKLNIQW